MLVSFYFILPEKFPPFYILPPSRFVTQIEYQYQKKKLNPNQTYHSLRMGGALRKQKPTHKHTLN